MGDPIDVAYLRGLSDEMLETVAYGREDAYEDSNCEPFAEVAANRAWAERDRRAEEAKAALLREEADAAGFTGFDIAVIS